MTRQAHAKAKDRQEAEGANLEMAEDKTNLETLKMDFSEDQG